MKSAQRAYEANLNVIGATRRMIQRTLDILKAMAFKETPHEALFVGDSPHDVAAGRAAGTRTAAALWGPFPRQALEEAGPDAFLHTQRDVLALLNGGGADR